MHSILSRHLTEKPWKSYVCFCSIIFAHRAKKKCDISNILQCAMYIPTKIWNNYSRTWSSGAAREVLCLKLKFPCFCNPSGDDEAFCSRHSTTILSTWAAERPDRTWQKAEWTCNMQCTKINVAVLWWCASIFLAEVKSHKHNKGLKFCEPGGLRSSIINISAQKPHGIAQKFCNVPSSM